MKMIERLCLRIITFIFHPSTLIYYKNFKGTIIYPKVLLRGARYMRITNSLIRTGCSFKTYPVSKTKSILIDIDKSYFGDNAYVSSRGGLYINDSGFAPHVFIGTYKHGLNRDEQDSAYTIKIEHTKFIGQNVSIFGNVNIKPGVVIGACSVVTKDCEENCMYVGNPAKRIKRFNSEKGVFDRIS